jgi:NitT/TauT family transport system ATP-binding protein
MDTFGRPRTRRALTVILKGGNVIRTGGRVFDISETSASNRDPEGQVAVHDRPDTVATLEGLTFVYPNGTHALSNLNLTLIEGGILGICGPSGCGKSSLLALLAGIRRPTAGEIRWTPDARPDGHARHPISMVFQKDTLLPWLTVTDNVNLFFALNRKHRAGAAAIADELLEMVGLQAFRRAYPYQLSGGMRRRAAFVVAMVARPRLLLLDEPFSSLDEPTRVAIHQDVFDVVRRLGTSVVLVTHDLAEAATLCDEIVILTDRPGTVAGRHAIPFGDERDVVELRERPEFLTLYGALWHELSLQIKHGKAAHT